MRARLRGRAGLTLIELLLAMVTGVVVISSVAAYVRTTDGTIRGSNAREDYTRKARFLGLAFRRDFGEAGVGIESLRGFGSVAVFNDTVTILKVPFEPNQEPAYNVALNPPSTTNATTNSSSSINCGTTCLRLRRTASGTPLTLTPGSLARVQRGTIRRLIVINTVASPAASDSVAVTFRSASAILRRPSITSGAPLGSISNTNTVVQRLSLVAYWRDASNNLWRATRINPANGAFSDAEIVATGVTEFEVRLVFQDGTIAANADSTVSGRHYNNINGILVRTTIQSDIVDPRANGGVPLQRSYVFRVTPRNLLYERNRTN
jgi:hypothetical protein